MSQDASVSLGSFHKLRLQLGWVGSRQNANLCKLRVRRNVGPCENVYVCKKFHLFPKLYLGNHYISYYSTFEYSLCLVQKEAILIFLVIFV
jgi:hypothetical protein